MEMDDSENDNEDRSSVSSYPNNAALIQKSEAAIQLVVSAAYELDLNIPLSRLGGACDWDNVTGFHEESCCASIVRSMGGSHVDVRRGDDTRDILSVSYSHIVLQLWLIITLKRLFSLRRVFKC